jgi:hypothetical protein
MKKENIYVEITNEKERLKAIEILQNAREEIGEYSSAMKRTSHYKILKFDSKEKHWFIGWTTDELTKITLNELEALLNPKQSNVFIDVQEWIRKNTPELTWVFTQKEEPECFKLLKEHLRNDYPKGTEIKISANEILISNK